MKPRRYLTQKQKDRLLQKQAYRCAVPECREPIGNGKRYEDDHWLARIDGGGEELENRRLICPRCHRVKSAGEHKANSKAKRIKFGRTRKGPPMAGSRKSRLKKHMDGSVSWR